MLIHRLWLTDFRGYTTAEATFDPGLTAVLGANGQGKTNLIEAIAYLATLRSFRGAPTDALVRAGADAAVVRAEAERDGRRLLLEAELSRRRPEPGPAQPPAAPSSRATSSVRCRSACSRPTTSP